MGKSAAKWNILGTNDASFNNGTGIASGAITSSKLSSTAVNSTVVDWSTTGGMWWQELGRATLASPAAIMSIPSFTAKKYLRIMLYMIPSGGAIIGGIYFNNDTGANYSTHQATNGGAAGDSVSQTNMIMAVDSAVTLRVADVQVFNLATQVKAVIAHCYSTTTSAAGGTNDRVVDGTWVNTSAAITRVDAIPTTNSFATGSEMIVLGHD